MKICSKCKKEKEINEFGFDKSRKDGRNIRCKECCNLYAKQNYKYVPLTGDQKERRRRWEGEYRKKCGPNNAKKCREWYQRNLERARKMSLEATKKYLATEKGKKKKNQRTCEWENKNPEKRRAQEKLQYWVKTGKIEKPNKCSKCELVCKLQAHHEDYSKPLEVVWLCARCHFLLHHEHKHHRERLNEKTPKGDAKVRPLEETQGLTQK